LREEKNNEKRFRKDFEEKGRKVLKPKAYLP
jgi:hypothetical protein